MKADHEGRFAAVLTAAGISLVREFPFGKDFARQYWKPRSDDPGFFGDFCITGENRADGRQLIVEIQGGVWMRGGSGHTGSGMLRDGAKSAAAVFLGLELLAITPHQIKSGAGLVAVQAWISRST